MTGLVFNKSIALTTHTSIQILTPLLVTKERQNKKKRQNKKGKKMREKTDLEKKYRIRKEKKE